jgi:hypothetical protein
MVMGGAVRGGNIFGNRDQGFYPEMQNLSAIDTGQGRLVPGVAVDEMARDLLTWFGVKASDMDYVLPGFTGRFGGRPSLNIMGDPMPIPTPTPPVVTPPVVTPPAATPTPSSSASSGGGGGSLGAWTFAAAGAMVALKKISERKKAKAAAAAAGTET